MRLTIGKKQALIVVILLLFVITIGGIAFISIGTVSQNLNFLTTRIYQMERVLKMRFFLTRVKDHFEALKNIKNTRELYPAKNLYADFLRFSEEMLSGLSGKEDKVTAVKFNELTGWLTERNNQYEIQARRGNWEYIENNFRDYTAKIEQVLQILDFLTNNIDQDVKATINMNTAYIRKTNFSIVLILMISIVLGVTLALYLTRAIVRSIHEVVHFAESIAENDLTCEIHDRYLSRKDETGDMAKAVDLMKKNLSDVVGMIKNRSESIGENIDGLAFSINNTLSTVQQFNVIVKEISEGSVNQKNFVQEVMTAVEEITRNIESVTKNVQSQTTAFEEFSAAIEEMTASINNIAGITNHAKDISDKLSNAAEDGFSLLTNVIRSINEVEQSSYKIRSIVDVIRNVAEQTNLLAMNAAIEAAHAGEYGKGFAVVAEEIRKLADNSMNSSKEIHGLLKNIIQIIKQSADLGQLANTGLEKIIHEIRDTTKINEEIFQSTQEQSKGAKEIIFSIHDLLSLVHENSSAVTEINKGSKDIAVAMLQLTEISRQFTEATEQHYSGSADILEYLAEEKFSVNKIKKVMGDFHQLILNFKLNQNGKIETIKTLPYTSKEVQ